MRVPTGGRRLTLELRADSLSSNSNSSSAFGITAALEEKKASGSQLQRSSSALQTTAATAGRAAAVIAIREPALQRSRYFASPTAAIALAVPGVPSLRNSSNQSNASLSGADSLSVSVGASASRLQLELAGDSSLSASADASHQPAHSPASPSRIAPLRGGGGRAVALTRLRVSRRRTLYCFGRCAAHVAVAHPAASRQTSVPTQRQLPNEDETPTRLLYTVSYISSILIFTCINISYNLFICFLRRAECSHYR